MAYRRVATVDHEIVAAARFGGLGTQQANGKDRRNCDSCIPGYPRRTRPEHAHLPAKIGVAEIVLMTDAVNCQSIHFMETIGVARSTQEKSFEIKDPGLLRCLEHGRAETASRKRHAPDSDKL
jgi:hypothetical protein